MADRTSIEWTDATWNPIVGCSVLSPGCTNCYAMRLSGTRLKHHPSRAGLTTETKAGPVWTGETRLDERTLLQPLRWRRPRKIFVCAHSDLFHDATPDGWIDRVFAIMALCPQHTFQVLTKRPERLLKYVGNLPNRVVLAADAGHLMGLWPSQCAEIERALRMPLPNVWIGVTAEDQTRANARIPVLLATPAAKRFVSIEPMLGPIHLDDIVMTGSFSDWHINALHCEEPGETKDHPIGDRTLDWVIVGGESGPNARPMHPDWVRAIRDQCAAAGVPFLFKQWGAWFPVLDRDRDDPDWRADYGRHERAGNRIVNLEGGCGFHGERVHVMRRQCKAAAGRTLDGVEHTEFPKEAAPCPAA